MNTRLQTPTHRSHPRRTAPAARFISYALLAITFLILPVSHSKGDTPALSFTGGTSFPSHGPTTGGWGFSLSNPVVLTSLGIYDGVQGDTFTASGSVGDGLATAHHVSLWTSAGVLIADAMVPAGMAAPLIGMFRYVSVLPILLPIGNYVIGAAYDETFVQDWAIGDASSITTAPGVTHLDSRRDSGDAFPAFGFPGNGIFGPNFQFANAPTGVPENGTSALLLFLGVSALFASRSLKRVANIRG